MCDCAHHGMAKYSERVAGDTLVPIGALGTPDPVPVDPAEPPVGIPAPLATVPIYHRPREDWHDLSAADIAKAERFPLRDVEGRLDTSRWQLSGGLAPNYRGDVEFARCWTCGGVMLRIAGDTKDDLCSTCLTEQMDEITMLRIARENRTNETSRR